MREHDVVSWTTAVGQRIIRVGRRTYGDDVLQTRRFAAVGQTLDKHRRVLDHLNVLFHLCFRQTTSGELCFSDI